MYHFDKKGTKVMGSSKITIKEIANLAGVSIATVSHVINRTRYVSPELIEKVEQIIRETGYIEKVAEKERKLKVGRSSVIVGIFPNIVSTVYWNMAAIMKKLVQEQGYQFMVVITGDDFLEEQQTIATLLSNKTIAGILLVPVSDRASDYKKLIASGMPFVCMEQNVLGEGIDSVVFQDRAALYKGTSYLIECGHKNILFLRENTENDTREERTKGFLEALQKNRMNVNDANIVDVDLRVEEERCQEVIHKALGRIMPTAVIAGGNWLTIQLLKVIKNRGINCPEELSVIGFGDEVWTELVEPPLTVLERDVEELSRLAFDMLSEKIRTGKANGKNCYATIELNIRKSIKMLDNGPYGEEPVSPDEISLTREEKRLLRKGNYRVAISFHYTGTAWALLHEEGIRDELEKYGIAVISVMDAHFDPALQNMQLDSICVQKPDAVIAIPTDDKKTREKFQELSKVSKLVFISNVPENIEKNSYVSCVSVNEWENGTNVGRLIGEYFRKNKNAKVGFINHGAIFYGTRVRDEAAEKILLDNYPNVEIVSIRSFGEIENAYQACKEMITSHPEIEALYVSWDRPALLAIKALKELRREDVAIFTTDLDQEIAGYIEKGVVKGMSTQRPYEQGRMAARVVAKSLVAENVPKYVGVQPYMIEPKELERAWKEIFHQAKPERL